MTNFFVNLLSFIPILLIIPGIKLVKPISGYYEDYLSKKSTLAVRGICAICIVLHHIAPAIVYGTKFKLVFLRFGSLGVSLFMFLSAYGLMKQHMSSDEYRNKFLLKRLPAVILPLFIFLFIFLGLEYTFGTYFTVSQILTFTFKYGRPDYFIPYSWFLILIIYFYIAFKIMMILCRNHYKWIPFCGLFFYFAYLLFCKKMGYGDRWYVTSFSFVLGLFWAAFENEILNIAKRYYLIITPICSITFLFLFVFIDYLSKVFSSIELFITAITSLFFVICVVLLLLKIKIDNRFSLFLGEIAFEIYLSSGILIKYLRSELVSKYHYIQSDLAYSLLVIVLTLIFAFIFHQPINFVLKNFRKYLNRT